MIDISFCSKEKSYNIIYQYHYSKVMPVLNKFYLLVKNEWKEIWTITLWRGTQPLWTINKIFPNHNLTTANYLEIWKMCFLAEYNKDNFWSQIMSALIKFMKSEMVFKDVLFLYTLADGIMWKPWYVYQASNFYYIGSFDTLVYYNEQTKEKIHPRTAKKLLKENEIFSKKDKLFWLTYDFMEHKWISKIQWKMYRYIYPIKKCAKKILNEYKNDFKNPKKEDLKRYKMTQWHKEEIGMPEFDMELEDGMNSKNINLFKLSLNKKSLFDY